MPKRRDLLFSEANIIKEIVNTRLNSVNHICFLERRLNCLSMSIN